MQALESATNIEDFAHRLDQLDLDCIKVKLMDEEEGPGWTLERCDEAEVWYKRFLFLCYKYPDSGFCPVADIDDFWHQHILDTKKYHQDCDDLFGYFMHHFPYLGMRSEQDAEELKEVASSTVRQYDRTK